MTPAVIVAGIIVAGLVVLAVSGGVVYLTAIGRDPGPVLQLVTQLVAAVGAVGSLVLQLVGRRTASKTERNTGAVVAALVKPEQRPWAASRTDTQRMTW